MGAKSHQPLLAFSVWALDTEKPRGEQSRAVGGDPGEPFLLESSSRPGHAPVSGKLEPFGERG